MSKLSREEIELEYNRNWFKNRVLDELINKTTPLKKKKAQLYCEKNREQTKDLPLIYIMINIDKLKQAKRKQYNKEYSKYYFFKQRPWLKNPDIL
jgi:hypothetical protein